MIQIRQVAPSELPEMQAGDEPVVLVDVREPHEFATGSLADAINIPLMELSPFLAGRATDEQLVFLCEVGQRSMQAATFAAMVGYTNVASVTGGMKAAGAT